MPSIFDDHSAMNRFKVMGGLNEYTHIDTVKSLQLQKKFEKELDIQAKSCIERGLLLMANDLLEVRHKSLHKTMSTITIWLELLQDNEEGYSGIAKMLNDTFFRRKKTIDYFDTLANQMYQNTNNPKNHITYFQVKDKFQDLVDFYRIKTEKEY